MIHGTDVFIYNTNVETIYKFHINIYICVYIYARDIYRRPFICENSFGRGRGKSLGKSFYEMRTVSSRLCTCRLPASNRSCLVPIVSAIPPPPWDKVNVNVGEKRRIPRILWTLGSLMISQDVAARSVALCFRRRYYLFPKRKYRDIRRLSRRLEKYYYKVL